MLISDQQNNELVRVTSFDTDAMPPIEASKFVVQLTKTVVTSLLDEAMLTPKPGLVDLRSRGAHHDLSWTLMCDSAWALAPFFMAMAQAGEAKSDLVTLREEIGQIGRAAEARMLQITGGVNTHRGAIWALGLLITAAAQNSEQLDSAAVTYRASVLAMQADRLMPHYSDNKGALACQMYGVGGAREQAQKGFPLVVHAALPELIRSRRRGEKENFARVNALLSIMEKLDDTCVLSRGGTEALAQVQGGAAHVLAMGGSGSVMGQIALNQLEEQMLALYVSPGGAADMLAATLFLDRLPYLKVTS